MAVTIAVTAGAFRDIPPGDVPDASSTTRIVQFIGGSFGSAILALILASSLTSHHAATRPGLQHRFLVGHRLHRDRAHPRHPAPRNEDAPARAVHGRPSPRRAARDHAAFKPCYRPPDNERGPEAKRLPRTVTMTAAVIVHLADARAPGENYLTTSNFQLGVFKFE